MYGIFTYIYNKNQLNVGKYTIRGFYGLGTVMMVNLAVSLLDAPTNLNSFTPKEKSTKNCLPHLVTPKEKSQKSGVLWKSLISA